MSGDNLQSFLENLFTGDVPDPGRAPPESIQPKSSEGESPAPVSTSFAGLSYLGAERTATDVKEQSQQAVVEPPIQPAPEHPELPAEPRKADLAPLGDRALSALSLLLAAEGDAGDRRGAESEMAEGREQRLNALLGWTALGGGVAVLALIPTLIQKPDRLPGYVPFLVGYALVVAMLVLRRVAFRWRVGVLVGVSYVLACFSLWQSGMSGTGPWYLLLIPLLFFVFVSERSGIISSVINVAVYIASGVAFRLRLLDVQAALEWEQSATQLLVLGATFAFMVTIVMTLQRLSARSQARVRKSLEEQSAALGKSYAVGTQRRQELERANALLHRQAQHFELGAQIGRIAAMGLGAEEFAARAVSLIQERLDSHYVGLFLLDTDRQCALLGATAGVSRQTLLPRQQRILITDDMLLQQCVSSGQARIVLGIDQVQNLSQGQGEGLFILEGMRSAVALPMLSQGQVFGVITVQSRSAAAFRSEDVASLRTVADQVSTAVLSAQLAEELRARLQELETLQRYYVREAWQGFLASEAVRSYEYDQPGVRALGDGALPEVDRVLADPQVMVLGQEIGSASNVLVAPISLRDQVLGVVGLQRMETDEPWSDEQVEVISAVSEQMGLIMENSRLFEQAERRAQELEMTARQLRETDQFRAQFLANMSHELRTPLNSIIGFSRVILKGIDGPLTDLQKTDLEAIYSNGQHLLTMINEILDVSKIEAGKMELVVENVDLNVLIRGVMSTSTALIKDKIIELRTNIRGDLPVIRADGTRIRQVITNLVSNAVKFTDDGSIVLSAWADDEMAYVSVEDTGEGIPEDKISLVFEPFRQVDGSSTRRAEGTGLGLPISRQFVELHGGRIWLESEYGVGSKVTFGVPIEGPIETVPELADLEIDEKKKLLLVIEQAESELEAYSQLADDGEYQVVGLYDGRKAVVWARYLRPWAILVDVEQETRVGWDALEALKSMRATRDYPVVICSAPEDVGRAISMGASTCVSKPVVIGDLSAALSRLQR